MLAKTIAESGEANRPVCALILSGPYRELTTILSSNFPVELIPLSNFTPYKANGFVRRHDLNEIGEFRSIAKKPSGL